MKFSSKISRKANLPNSERTSFRKRTDSTTNPTLKKRELNAEEEEVLYLEENTKALKELFPLWDSESLRTLFEAYEEDLVLTVHAILKINQEHEATNSRENTTLNPNFHSHSSRVRLPDDFLRVPTSYNSSISNDDEWNQDDTNSLHDEDEDDQDLKNVDQDSVIVCTDGNEERKSLHRNQRIAGYSTLFSSDESETAMVKSKSKSAGSIEMDLDHEDQDEETCSSLSALHYQGSNELFGRHLDKDEQLNDNGILETTCEIEEQQQDIDARQSQHHMMVEKENGHDSSFTNTEIEHELQPSLVAQVSSSHQSGTKSNLLKGMHLSPLDIPAAESRIRKQEFHGVFDFLAKSSLLYQKGVINAEELENLRSHLLNCARRSDKEKNSANGNYLTEQEWHSLILKSKGIRQALSIRIIRCSFRYAPGVIDSGYAVFLIRVVDIETAAVWFVNRRFKEFYKLQKKLAQLSPRLAEIAFPNRRPTKLSDEELANERQPILEAFLRSASGLISPSPIDFLRGCALKELQRFLDVPRRYQSLQVLHLDKWKTIEQNVRVVVNQILNDPLSEEGVACSKFFIKMKDKVNAGQYVGILGDVSDFLDNVQAYMMKHHYDSFMQICERFGVDENCSKEDSLQLLIADCIRIEIEDKTFFPLSRDVFYYLEQSLRTEEIALYATIKRLRGKPQSFFEIPVEHISESSWEPVISEFNNMNSLQLPSEKLKCIVLAANHIHKLHKSEHSKPHFGDSAFPESDRVLSGDDFLPIFIYVIVHSDLDHLLVTKEVLSALCDSEKRLGETGYYLASFEAAIHHLLSTE